MSSGHGPLWQSCRRWRLIGPGYDPDDDADHHMSGGTLADWFDVVIHCQNVTATRALLTASSASSVDEAVLR